MENNIYYHFLDRELRSSVDVAFTDNEILEIISFSLLMTSNKLFFSISNLYESFFDFPNSSLYIEKLRNEGMALALCSHETKEEFIFTRQEMYFHDKTRYPIYFEKKDIILYDNLFNLKDSTSGILRSKFLSIGLEIPLLDVSINKKINKKLKHIITNEPKKAITTVLFKDVLKSNKYRKHENDLILINIKTKISELYTQRYLQPINGNIITAIGKLSYYDKFASDYYSNNIFLYKYILNNIGLNVYGGSFFNFIYKIRRNNDIFCYIHDMLKNIIFSFKKYISKCKTQDYRVNINILNPNLRYDRIVDEVTLVQNIEKYVDELRMRNLFIDNIYFSEEESKMTIEKNEKKSIIIIGITKVEYQGFNKSLKKYFGNVGLVDVNCDNFICKRIVPHKHDIYYISPPSMGTSPAGGITHFMHEIKDKFNPDYIIMGGICFGANETKQKLGDILVARQVWNYEPMKEGENESIPRGDKEQSSIALQSKFKNSDLEYMPLHNASIYFGLLASGDKLLNSKSCIDDLVTHEPEILGGDMEAAGLMGACKTHRIECIVVKAICDWGYKKDDDYQEVAANNSFDYIMYTLHKKILT